MTSLSPMCSVEEFTSALFGVVGKTADAPMAVAIRNRSKEVADIVNARRSTIPGLSGNTAGLANGGEVAAEWIWQTASGEKEGVERETMVSP